MTATTVSSSFAPARDFLRVTVPTVGTSASVSLALDDVAVTNVPITEVAPEAVAHVSVVPQSTDTTENGDLVALYAHAIDATLADVYGARFDWFVNGEVPEGGVADGPADIVLLQLRQRGEGDRDGVVQSVHRIDERVRTRHGRQAHRERGLHPDGRRGILRHAVLPRRPGPGDGRRRPRDPSQGISRGALAVRPTSRADAQNPNGTSSARCLRHVR